MEQDPPRTLRAVENLINEDRIISFSDAVFAFAATLLVLKIDLPDINLSTNSAQLTTVLINLWPQYLANIISFLIISFYWLNHHAIFALIKKFNSTIIWLNIVFLIFISFIPFPVDLFGDFSNLNTVIIFYSLSIAAAGFLLASIWLYASSNKLVNPQMSKQEFNYYTLRFLLTPVIFALSIPLVLIDPIIAKVSWVFVIIGILIINQFFNFKGNKTAQ